MEKSASKIQCVNLPLHARQRDVVQDGAAGMAELIRIVLGEKIDKSPEVRPSQWSSKTLTEEQIICDVCCQTCLLAS